MKSLVLIGLALIGSGSSAFAQMQSSTQDYNGCINGWRSFDGGISAGREQRCMNSIFASCIVSYNQQGPIVQSEIDHCANAQDTYNPYNPQQPTGYYDSCISAWRSFDGGLNQGREQRCEDNTFASCMTSFLQSQGRVDQPAIDRCVYQAATPSYPQPQPSYPQPQPQPYPQPAPQPYPQPQPQPQPYPQPQPQPYPQPRPQPAPGPVYGSPVYQGNPPPPRITCEIRSGANAYGQQFFRVLTSSGAIIGNFSTTGEASNFAMNDSRCR